ncbi:Nn.00g076730.m01.CDS01 [Neocucurbitaria sp. VM-36]
MQPYPQQQQPPDNDRTEGGHRGPLSRTWPQLFKKRRRYSPVRESALQQQQAQIPQVQPFQQTQQHVQLPIYPILPINSPSTSTQPITSPISSMRSPSIAADTASTLSTLSHASSAPPKKIPISRRSSSIATPDNNGAGGVATPQADLLASKSNYELISSGQHLEMGLHFSTAMATGVMMKRATHRAAEQARRDRMKTAMVDLAEFLLDGEVTFGSGTTCFVVMRGKDGEEGVGNADGKKGSVAGEKKTVNKARLIEMALEKMKAQEKEIEMLRKELEDMRPVGDPTDRMDET